jgi:hypothetical protein
MSFVTFLVGAWYMELYHYELGFELEDVFSLRESSCRNCLESINRQKEYKGPQIPYQKLLDCELQIKWL